MGFPVFPAPSASNTPTTYVLQVSFGYLFLFLLSVVHSVPGAVSLSPLRCGCGCLSQRLDGVKNDWIAVYSGQNRQFKDEKLRPATTYHYRLQAWNKFGRSGYALGVLQTSDQDCTFGSLALNLLYSFMISLVSGNGVIQFLFGTGLLLHSLCVGNIWGCCLRGASSGYEVANENEEEETKPRSSWRQWLLEGCCFNRSHGQSKATNVTASQFYRQLANGAIVKREGSFNSKKRRASTPKVVDKFAEFDVSHIDMSRCNICEKKFNVIRMRHHCSNCHRVFCGKHGFHPHIGPNCRLPGNGISKKDCVCYVCVRNGVLDDVAKETRSRKVHRAIRKAPAVLAKFQQPPTPSMALAQLRRVSSSQSSRGNI